MFFLFIQRVGEVLGYFFVGSILLSLFNINNTGPYLFIGGTITFVLSGIFQTLGHIGQNNMKYPWFTIPVLLFLNLILAFWDFLIIPWYFIFIIFDLISGMGMLLLFFLSSTGLVIYFVEDIIGYDIKGVSFLDNGTHALIALGCAIVSGTVLFYFMQSEEDKVLEFATKLTWKIRTSIISWSNRVQEKYCTAKHCKKQAPPD